MNSRDRVLAALNHRIPDRVPFDLGATNATGISVHSLYRLRKELGLESHVLTMHDPYQVLGLVENDVLAAIRADCVGMWPKATIFGYRNEGWKKWVFPDGTEVLVGRDFVTTRDHDGNTYLYPRGDTNGGPSGVLPKGGYYFDAITRQGIIDENDLHPTEDFRDDYVVLSQEELRAQEEESKALYENTDFAIVSVLIPASFNDFAHLPGPFLKEPRGIRDPVRWLEYHYTHPEYIKEVNEYQTEIALENLKLHREAVGERIQVIVVSGADYGTQNGELQSADMYREFIKPYQKKVNDWIHTHTSWKTFYHTCGSVVRLLDDFIEAGIDILNPVQTSARGMDPRFLKETYGARLVFWGGAADVQTVLSSADPEAVASSVRENLDIFSQGGGFICAATHNIQATTPVENIMAFIWAVHGYMVASRS